MRILFYQWHSFMNRGIERALKQLDIEYDVLFYQQTDWEQDDGLMARLEMQLKKKDYTCVLSVNYAPLVSKVCENEKVLYVSWVYDAPIHIRDISSMYHKCNRIFFFDRIQAESYRQMGIWAYHMPLAADIYTFGGRKTIENKAPIYQADVSLIGKLYQTEYAYYSTPLTTYLKGYLEGIINSQKTVYGGYFLGEMLDETLLKQLNEIYDKASNGTASITKEQLEFMLASEITGRERYLALALLSNHFKTQLYSTDKDERLTNVDYKGYADYYSQMPEIFKKSKVNLNISLKIIQSGVPLRVFDILGSGGFLLTNFQAEMPEYFTIGEDFVMYENIEDLYAKAAFYIKNDTERMRIARHGYETVEKYHTFEQRMEVILKEALR